VFYFAECPSVSEVEDVPPHNYTISYNPGRHPCYILTHSEGSGQHTVGVLERAAFLVREPHVRRCLFLPDVCVCDRNVTQPDELHVVGRVYASRVARTTRTGRFVRRK
jgi:hypothetical protein